MLQVAILGAGISGLTAAWQLQKQFGKNISITLFEKQNTAGGWIRSYRSEQFFFECGPRALRKKDCGSVMELMRDLDLQTELIESDFCANKRYFLRQGKLEVLGLTFFLRFPMLQECLKALYKDLTAPRGVLADESVYDFFERRFSRNIADQLIDPLIKGIYGGDPAKLSIKACFPMLCDLESRYRSLIFASIFEKLKKKKASTPGLITLKKGLSTLIERLQDRLHHPVRLSAEVEKVEFAADHIVLGCAKKMERFDAVISTLPAPVLASLIDDQKLQDLLKKIPYADVNVAHLGFNKPVNPYKGFGYLVPAIEKQSIMGVVFDSAVFPNQNLQNGQTRMTVMSSVPNTNSQAVREHLKITALPDFEGEFFARAAIPQYPVGYPQIREEIMQRTKKLPRLLLLGSSFYGVSVNQLVMNAKKMAACLSKNGFWHQNCLLDKTI